MTSTTDPRNLRAPGAQPSGVLVDSNDVGLRLPTGHQLCQPELLWQTLQEIVQHRDGLQRMPLPVGAGVATFVNDVQLSEISDAARMLAVGDFR